MTPKAPMLLLLVPRVAAILTQAMVWTREAKDRVYRQAPRVTCHWCWPWFHRVQETGSLFPGTPNLLEDPPPPDLVFSCAHILHLSSEQSGKSRSPCLDTCRSLSSHLTLTQRWGGLWEGSHTPTVAPQSESQGWVR